MSIILKFLLVLLDLRENLHFFLITLIFSYLSVHFLLVNLILEALSVGEIFLDNLLLFCSVSILFLLLLEFVYKTPQLLLTIFLLPFSCPNDRTLWHIHGLTHTVNKHLLKVELAIAGRHLALTWALHDIRHLIFELGHKLSLLLF